MEAASARIIDDNGYVTVARNPVTREGVFPYMGRSIPGAPDPNKIYMVYRPASELIDPECIASFGGLPITDDHPELLFSENYGPDSHNLHGTSDNNVTFENGILYTGIRIFTKTLKGLINAGKKALSAGYKCRFVKEAGVFNGIAYDYVQRNIRGNHISLVREGRSGPEIAVLDHHDVHMAFDSFDLALDETENKGTTDMADKDDKKADDAEAKDSDTKEKDGDQSEAKDADGDASGEADAAEEKEMTLSEVSACLAKILPVIKEIQDGLGAMRADETAALDEDEDDKKDKDGKAMDSAVDSRLKKLESRNPVKEALAQIKSRDVLAKDITPLVGSFDHADMTVEEVEAYACDKLDIKVAPAHRSAALAGAIAASKKTTSGVGFAMDSTAAVGVKTDGLLAKRINKTA